MVSSSVRMLTHRATQSLLIRTSVLSQFCSNIKFTWRTVQYLEGYPTLNVTIYVVSDSGRAFSPHSRPCVWRHLHVDWNDGSWPYKTPVIYKHGTYLNTSISLTSADIFENMSYRMLRRVVLYEVPKFRNNVLPPPSRKILNLLPGRRKQDGPAKYQTRSLITKLHIPECSSTERSRFMRIWNRAI